MPARSEKCPQSSPGGQRKPVEYKGACAVGPIIGELISPKQDVVLISPKQDVVLISPKQDVVRDSISPISPPRMSRMNSEIAMLVVLATAVTVPVSYAVAHAKAATPPAPPKRDIRVVDPLTAKELQVLENAANKTLSLTRIERTDKPAALSSEAPVVDLRETTADTPAGVVRHITIRVVGNGNATHQISDIGIDAAGAKNGFAASGIKNDGSAIVAAPEFIESGKTQAKISVTTEDGQKIQVPIAAKSVPAKPLKDAFGNTVGFYSMVVDGGGGAMLKTFSPANRPMPTVNVTATQGLLTGQSFTAKGSQAGADDVGDVSTRTYSVLAGASGQTPMGHVSVEISPNVITNTPGKNIASVRQPNQITLEQASLYVPYVPFSKPDAAVNKADVGGLGR